VDALKQLFDSGSVSDADLESEDLSCKSIRDVTPLHRAISGGHEHAVRFLVGRGADLGRSAKDDYGSPELTALDLAAECGHSDVTKALLEAGAGARQYHVKAPNDASIALQVAAGDGHDEVVRVLLEWSRLNEQPMNKSHTLDAAAGGYHLDVVRTLLEFWDIGPDQDDELLNITLCCACTERYILPGQEELDPEAVRRERQKRTVSFLLDAGADVNFFWKWIDSAPILSVSQIPGAGDVLRLLLDAGADVSVADCGGRQTALHFAAMIKDKEIAELLLAHGADVNAKDTTLRTPLHVAIYCGVGFVQLLLDHGADPATQDSKDRTPLGLVEENRKAELEFALECDLTRMSESDLVQTSEFDGIRTLLGAGQLAASQ
jgi:ankyrin repeat protein